MKGWLVGEVAHSNETLNPSVATFQGGRLYFRYEANRRKPPLLLLRQTHRTLACSCGGSNSSIPAHDLSGRATIPSISATEVLSPGI